MNSKESILVLCSKHGEKFENKNLKIEITNELFKCKKCTKNYPIRVNCSMNGESKFISKLSEYQTKNQVFKPPPNITYNPSKAPFIFRI